MSTTSPIEVFEAQLIEPDDINPFASPGAHPPAETPSIIGPGIGRASAAEIRFTLRSLVASEISYLFLWLAGFSTTIWNSELTILVWICMLLVAWFFFARMVVSHGEFDLITFAIVFSFPIPLFGFLIFFAARGQARRFLVWNGYKPGFIGASPDPEEIAAMNADPNYRPSVMWHRNGSRRTRFR